AEAVPFLVNVPEGKVRPLSPPEELAGEGRVVLRRIASRDGARLDAYIVYPPDSYEKPYPIVALPPDEFNERAHGRARSGEPVLRRARLPGGPGQPSRLRWIRPGASSGRDRRRPGRPVHRRRGRRRP